MILVNKIKKIYYIDKLKNNLINDIQDKKKEKIYPEENHFKAVFYSQEIKRFNNNLE